MTLNGIRLIVRQTFSALQRDGLRVAFIFLMVNLQRKAGSKEAKLHRLRPRALAHSVTLRAGRSDFFFYGQIFIDDEFAPVRSLQVRNIVDLGGNIGLASVWCLNQFPEARVVTIEANPVNYASLAMNLAPYGSRAVTVEGGVWWRNAGLTVLRRQNEGDAQVRERQPGDDLATSIDGWDIPSLMERGGFDHVDLLKMDVEGAEVELFEHGADRWLPLVRNLALETHGPHCEAALERGLRHYNYRKAVRGELTFYLGLERKRNELATQAGGPSNGAARLSQ